MRRHHLDSSVSAAPELRAQEQAESALIERSGLFDRVWYIARFPEIADSALDPILDYIRHGARAGRNPNPLFEDEWYLERYPDARAVGGSPLIHYLLHGAAEGREPGPFFDTQWYLAQHPELKLHAIERQAMADVLAPSHPGDFLDLKAPARGGSAAASASINPLAHYLRDGWLRGSLAFDPGRLLVGMKVAVIVHLFYADLWEEITGFLRNIPIGFDLFVSVPREYAGALSAMVLRDHPRAQIIEVPNAGRDVGAFFAVLPRLIAGNYSVLCKLHSKKGTQYPAAWRDLLLRGVLANKMLVARILHAFASSPELVLVGARDVYLSGTTQMTRNRAKLEEITQLLCPGRSLPDNWGFFAGTMFWARPDFFRPFVQIADSLESFEDDNSRGDGQLAHAVERMFGAFAALEGKRIGLTEITGPRPLEGTIHVTQAPAQPWKGSFVRVLRAHALEQSGELPFGRALGPSSYGETSGDKSSGSQHPRKPTVRFGIAALVGSRGARVSERIARLPRYARQPLRLVWWTMTLQIVPRLHDFCIKRAQARLVASSPLFDCNWYLERYPSVRAANVDPAFHYVARGVADACDPGPRFDTMWYLAYYSDVAAWGINPLVHYLRQGAKEGRHTNPREIVIGEVTDAALSCRKFPGAAGEVSLFVTHSPHGLLKPHVRHHLEALRRHGISPVLIVAADAEFREPDGALLALLDGLYVRQNVGYDFAAWAHVLRENPKLLSADILYLINDSTIGPLNEQKFAALLRKVRDSKSDLVGLTDSYERGWHIQSYFLALKRAALSSPALQGFLAGVKNLAEKRAVVNAYEARLASILQGVGLRCEVLYPARNARNPSLVDWRALIGSGLPFVKVAALRNFSRHVGHGDWRTVLQAEGFDPGLADQALAAATPSD